MNDQRSLYDQLKDLKDLANKSGLCEAADFLSKHIPSMIPDNFVRVTKRTFINNGYGTSTTYDHAEYPVGNDSGQSLDSVVKFLMDAHKNDPNCKIVSFDSRPTGTVIKDYD